MNDANLEPLSDVVVPAGGYVPAFVVPSGHVLRIEDVAGQQAADVMITAADEVADWMSCIYTTLLNRTTRITREHVLYSKLAHPLATVVEDTAGTHWFGGGFCSAETNEFRYGIADTPSCRGNLAASLANYVPDAVALQLDACASLFMNIEVDEQGHMSIASPPDRAGDYLSLRAEVDLLVAVSACPEAHNPCNAFNPTPIRLTTYVG